MSAPAATHPTLEEIDEALIWATSAPRTERWLEWIDRLLDVRLDVQAGGVPPSAADVQQEQASSNKDQPDNSAGA